MALDDSWMSEGLCATLPSDVADRLFFPPKRRGYRTDYSEAKKICRTCPVRVPCLAYAIAHGIPEGVWGAYSPDERKRMDRELKVRYRKVWWRMHPLSRASR
jgi:WhiB family redox-sensing transcriptional regulator